LLDENLRIGFMNRLSINLHIRFAAMDNFNYTRFFHRGDDSYVPHCGGFAACHLPARIDDQAADAGRTFLEQNVSMPRVTPDRVGIDPAAIDLMIERMIELPWQTEAPINKTGTVTRVVFPGAVVPFGKELSPAEAIANTATYLTARPLEEL